jgi:hypothetical protein
LSNADSDHSDRLVVPSVSPTETVHIAHGFFCSIRQKYEFSKRFPKFAAKRLKNQPMSKTKKTEPSKKPEVIGGAKTKSSDAKTEKKPAFGSGNETPEFVLQELTESESGKLGKSTKEESANINNEPEVCNPPIESESERDAEIVPATLEKQSLSSSQIIALINENWDQYPDEEKALHLEIASHIAAKHGFKLVKENQKPDGIEIISISESDIVEKFSLDDVKTSEQILAATSEEPINMDQRALFIKQRIESLSTTKNFDHGVVTRTQEVDPIEKMRQCGRNIIEEIKRTNDYVFHKRINTNKVEMMIKNLGSAYTPDVTINNKGCQFKLRKNDVTIRFPEDENEYIQVM